LLASVYCHIFDMVPGKEGRGKLGKSEQKAVIVPWWWFNGQHC